MRILVIGAGGVGSAAVGIADRRAFFEHLVVADYDPARVTAALAQVEGDARFSGARVDASDRAAIVALIHEHRITHVLNAVDPRFVMPIFDACFEAGVTYLDMAMSLSRPHPERPHELPGEKLGDAQFAVAARLGGTRPARAGGHRRGARPVRRVRALRAGRAVQRDRRGGRARRGEPHRRRLRVRAVVLDLDDDRGVPQPAGHLGGRAAGSRRRRSASPRCSTSRRASGRSSA